ncbi:ABC transporter substrate-binding protein [Psychrobacter phenylpyruvicus]|uniref:Oligopeptide-binding protein AppA n=1 Tax=Psychrobacter phenylpyruvicus TaxID=29432 RepID=A0A379LJH0_9GAMM|nr:ABC transporter substrate-binding protein [Psychrobacter phenylpyruvicus]SUD90561.1 Oligopeptide-binding protein AppA precursor [Psychrobacter phenylpyruvicus]
MNTRSIGMFGLVALLLVIIIGCSSADNKTDNNSNNKIASETKEELVLAFGSEPEAGFDPITGWGRYGSPLFQSTLLKRDDDLNIVNDLATSYEVSDDGTVWTVHLRDDVKFSDGEPLTAKDVKFTFEKALQSASVVDLNILQKVEAIDDTVVRFTLKKPQSTFVNSLVATGIVPEHAYDNNYAQNPIGSGPYQLVQWDKGQQLIVKENPEYYGKHPYFKKLTFLFLSEDAAFAAAQAGTVDMTYLPAAFSNKEISGMKLKAVKTVDNRGIAFPYVKSGQVKENGLPIGNDVTADPAIRHAIDVAVDRKALIDGVLEGYGSPAYTSVDHLPWWNPETVIEDANLDAARKILADAGWSDTDGDGVLDKGSLKAEFKLYYLASDIVRQSLAIAVADMVKPLGIKIDIEGGSWDVISEKMHSEAVLMGWGSHNPYELVNIYATQNAGVDYNNTGYYSNKTVDRYFDKALQANSEQEANEYWKKAQWDGTTGLSGKGDAAWVWLVNIDHLYLMKNELDIGKQRIHVHGHGWPATDNIVDWRWKQ